MAGRTAPRRLKRRHQHAGIDGNDAALVGKHGVEVELAQLRQVGGKLRELDEEERDGVDVDGRDVAISLQHAGDTRPRDQVARELEIERRQRQGLVVDDLDRGAAAAEHHDRAEGRIVRNAGDQFPRLRAHDHRMKRHAGDARIRPRTPCPREDIGDRVADRRFVGEIQPDAADLRFMNDIGRKDFGHHPEPLGQPRARGDSGLVSIAGKERGCDRDGISREQPRHLDRIEPRASALHRTGDDCARRGDVRLEVLRQARRRRHQVVLRLPIAHQVHKPLDRIGFGLVARNAVGFEDWRDGIAGADPDGKNGLRPDHAVAVRPRDGGDRSGDGRRRRKRGRNVHDQDGIVLGIRDETLERGDIAGGIGVAGDVDGVGSRPDRRQRRIRASAWLPAKCRRGCRRDRRDGRRPEPRCPRRWSGSPAACRGMAAPARASRPQRTTRRGRAPAIGRRAETPLRRPRPSRRARRYASAPPSHLAHGAPT